MTVRKPHLCFAYFQWANGFSFRFRSGLHSLFQAHPGSNSTWSNLIVSFWHPSPAQHLAAVQGARCSSLAALSLACYPHWSPPLSWKLTPVWPLMCPQLQLCSHFQPVSFNPLAPTSTPTSGSQLLALSFYLLSSPAAVAFSAVRPSMRSLAAVDQWAAGANACLSPPLTSYPYTHIHTHANTSTHTHAHREIHTHSHAPSGCSRWGSARGKGCGVLQRVGLGVFSVCLGCVCVSFMYVCLCVTQLIPQFVINSHIFAVCVCVWGAVVGHLLAACPQYGQVLASAVSRLVSAAAATPLLHPALPSHLSPSDRCSHTTTTSQLFMGPACFDFKYLPRRRLFSMGKEGLKKSGVCAWNDTHSHKQEYSKTPTGTIYAKQLCVGSEMCIVAPFLLDFKVQYQDGCLFYS